MKCSVCDKENEKDRTHCERCGTLLTQDMRSDESGKRKVFIPLVLLFLILAGLAYLFREALFSEGKQYPDLSVAEREKYEKRVSELEAKLEAKKAKLSAAKRLYETALAQSGQQNVGAAN